MSEPGEQAVDPDELLAFVESQQAQIEAVRQQVASSAADGAAGVAPKEAATVTSTVLALGPAAERLAGEEAADVAGDLLPWVEWLVRSHALGDVWLPCWAEHGRLFQQVAALRVWHDEALRDLAGAGQALTAWYDRGLLPFLANELRHLGAECSPTGHRDTGTYHAERARAATGRAALPIPRVLSEPPALTGGGEIERR